MITCEKITIEVCDDNEKEVIMYLGDRIHNQRREIRRLYDTVFELRQAVDVLKAQTAEAYIASIRNDNQATWVSVQDRLPISDVGLVNVIYRRNNQPIKGKDVYDAWRSKWVLYDEAVEYWEDNSEENNV